MDTVFPESVSILSPDSCGYSLTGRLQSGLALNLGCQLPIGAMKVWGGLAAHTMPGGECITYEKYHLSCSDVENVPS